MNARKALRDLVAAFHGDDDEVDLPERERGAAQDPDDRGSAAGSVADHDDTDVEAGHGRDDKATSAGSVADHDDTDVEAGHGRDDKATSAGFEADHDDADVEAGHGRDDKTNSAGSVADLDHVGDALADLEGARAARAGGGAAAAMADPDDAAPATFGEDSQGDSGGGHANQASVAGGSIDSGGPSDRGGGHVVPASVAARGGDGDAHGSDVDGQRDDDGDASLPSADGLVTLTKKHRQSTLQTTEVVRHLLWHKAMADYEDDGHRLSGYIDLVTTSAEGEHVSIRDDFHRDLAIAFELVMQHHMDPWDLDLSKFAELYLKEAAARGVDLVTSGRIILMAWTVLKLQSDEVAEKAVFLEQEEEHLAWDDVPDWDYGDDEWDYTDRVTHAPRAPIDEKIRHKGDRRVTLMELIGAFEEVHQEARERQELQSIKLRERLSLQRKMRGKVGNMMHTEDLQAEVAETWQRILDHPAHPIPFSQLHEWQSVDLVQTFTGVLFLAKDGRVRVSQEDFPRGEIWLTPMLPEAADAAGTEGASP